MDEGVVDYWWNANQFTKKYTEYSNNLVDQAYQNTPPQYNHNIGMCFLYNQISTGRVIGYVNLPKCMSTIIKEALETCLDMKIIPNEANANIEVSNIEFFAVTRDEHERAVSGHREWQSYDYLIRDPVRTKDISLPTLEEKQSITLDELLSKPEIWDEHIEPQVTFLKPFEELDVDLQIFKLDNTIVAQLTEFFGYNILVNFRWREQ